MRVRSDYDLGAFALIPSNVDPPFVVWHPDGTWVFYRRDGSEALRLGEDAWVRLVERLARIGSDVGSDV